MRDFHKLLEFCQTETQTRHIQRIIDCGSIRAAAKSLGQDERRLRDSIARVEKYAVMRGYSPDDGWNNGSPKGTVAAGVSTLYRDDGSVAMQWVKSSLDKEKQLELYREAIEALKEDLPKYKPLRHDNGKVDSNLVNLYSLFDFHMGAKSWKEECGENWDLNISKETMYRFFEYAISRTPRAHSCIINLGGDFLHWDGLLAAETPTSKHSLDADTRFAHVIRVALITIRQVINMCLAKYKKVHLLVQEGNHDITSSAWLRETLAHCYDNNKRIEVNTSANPYYAYEWGRTALFFHHGHLKKRDNLDALFASQFREIYGRTKYSYAHSGHYHHKIVSESNLMITQQHGSLTAKDSYAARHGFNSQRCAEVHTYSKQYGLCNILPVHVDMLGEMK